jgi:hypothetical protein
MSAPQRERRRGHPYGDGLGESVTTRAEGDLSRLPAWLSRCRSPLPPLALVVDIGGLLAGAEIRSLSPNARGAYAEAVARWRMIPQVKSAAALRPPDAVLAATIASITEGIADPRGARLGPGDVDGLVHAVAAGSMTAPWATRSTLALIEERLRQLDTVQLRRSVALGEGSGVMTSALRGVAEGLTLPEARAAAAVAQRLAPMLRLATAPQGTQLATAGGYADLTRRGELDSLVLSELALPEDEFLRRYAEGELLHYSREAPPTHRPRRVTCFVDTGPLTWGSMRLVGCGAAMALDAVCRRRGDAFSLALASAEAPFEERALDETGLVHLLGHRHWGLDPAPTLAALAESVAPGSDLVAVVPLDLFGRTVEILARLARAARAFVVELSPGGQVRLLSLHRNGVRLLGGAELSPSVVEHALDRSARDRRLAPAAAGALPFVRGALWGRPTVARFSIDGRYLVVADSRGTISVLSTSDGTLVASAGGGSVNGMALSGANDLGVRTPGGFSTFELPTLSKLASEERPTWPNQAEVPALVFAMGRGRTIALAHPSHVAVGELGHPFRSVWRRRDEAEGVVPTAIAVSELPGNESHDIVVVGYSNGEVVALAAEGGSHQRVSVCAEEIVHVAAAIEGLGMPRVVAASSRAGAQISFGPDLNESIQAVPLRIGEGSIVAVAPGGSHFLVTPAYRQLAVHSISGRHVCTFEDVGGYTEAQLSPGGHEVALRGEGLQVWRTSSADLAWEAKPPAHSQADVHLSASSDGRVIAFGGGPHLGLFRIGPGKVEAEALVTSTGQAPACLAISADGRYLACADDAGALRLLSVGAGLKLVQQEGRLVRHRRVSFDPDGNLIVSRGVDGVVRVYHAQLLAQMRGFTNCADFAEPLLLGGGAIGLPMRDGYTVRSVSGPVLKKSLLADHAAVSLATSPSGKIHCALTADGRVIALGTSLGRSIIAAAGETRVSVADDGMLALYGPTSVRLLRSDGESTVLGPLLGSVCEVVFAGPFCVIGTSAGVATVFACRTGEPRAHLACGPWGAVVAARSGRCAGSVEALSRVSYAPGVKGSSPQLDPAGAGEAIWDGLKVNGKAQ